MIKLSELMKIRGNLCCYCRTVTKLPMERGSVFYMATREHITPKTQGGKDDIDNLDISCYSCNCTKSDMSDEEFRKSYKLEKRIIELKKLKERLKDRIQTNTPKYGDEELLERLEYI
jgi:5-methylcytosine-specific restriction endonuclease McrA